MTLVLWQQIILWSVPVLFAVVLHEMAHGFVALLCGDTTAKDAGRLSLNPFRHLSLSGSLLVPAFLLYFTNFVFGWAKPVPVDPRGLNKPRENMVFVALAGPFSNLFMALFWALLIKISLLFGQNAGMFVAMIVLLGAAGVFINIILIMFNILPLPPLDGSKVLISLLPITVGNIVAKLEPWGFPILMILIFTGILNKIIWPMIAFGLAFITYIYQIPEGLLETSLHILMN